MNVAAGEFTGFSSPPIVNYALKDFRGLQLGLVNYAENFHGGDRAHFQLSR